jgi:hypothetical protein
LIGELAALLSIGQHENAAALAAASNSLKLVAGARNHRERQLLKTAIRSDCPRECGQAWANKARIGHSNIQIGKLRKLLLCCSRRISSGALDTSETQDADGGRGDHQNIRRVAIIILVGRDG